MISEITKRQLRYIDFVWTAHFWQDSMRFFVDPLPSETGMNVFFFLKQSFKVSGNGTKGIQQMRKENRLKHGMNSQSLWCLNQDLLPLSPFLAQ